MSKHNDIYNILGKLNSLAPAQAQPAKQESLLKTLNESNTPLAKTIRSLNEKYAAAKEDVLSPKQKKFAALAEPKNKITYADKIAGAKKDGKKSKDVKEGRINEGAVPFNGEADYAKIAKWKETYMRVNPRLEPEEAEEKACNKLGFDYEEVLDWVNNNQFNEGEGDVVPDKSWVKHPEDPASKVPAYQRKAADPGRMSAADAADEKNKAAGAKVWRSGRKTDMNETALKDANDLAAKRKALDDLAKEPGADQEAIKQRRADLEAEAEKMGLSEGFPTVADARARSEKEKGTGKFDKKQTGTGTVYTRKSDTFSDDGDDKEASTDGAPKKRGRPAKNKGPERVTSKAYKHKGGRVSEAKKPIKLDTFVEDTLAEMDNLMLSEKAVSQAQQKFMGMVYATKKGEKPASARVAKAAKGMSATDAKDFANTKRKGLPVKVTESIQLNENLSKIENRYGKEVREFMDSGVMDSDLYHALHDYYYDDMPASVKRGGNTQEWVSNKFNSDMGGTQLELDLDHVPTVGPDHQLSELARLAGLSEAKKPDEDGDGVPDWADEKPGEDDNAKCNHTEKGKECPVHGLKECGGMWESRFNSIVKEENDTDDEEMVDDEETEELEECGMGMPAQEQDSGLSINSSMDTKTGRKTLSVTADGETAEQLARILKMAGMAAGTISGDEHAEHDHDVEVIQVGAPEQEHEVDEEFINKPEPKVASVDAINNQGTDLNRQKKQDPATANRAANPMAVSEASARIQGRLAQMYAALDKK